MKHRSYFSNTLSQNNKKESLKTLQVSWGLSRMWECGRMSSGLGGGSPPWPSPPPADSWGWPGSLFPTWTHVSCLGTQDTKPVALQCPFHYSVSLSIPIRHRCIFYSTILRKDTSILLLTVVHSPYCNKT